MCVVSRDFEACIIIAEVYTMHTPPFFCALNPHNLALPIIRTLTLLFFFCPGMAKLLKKKYCKNTWNYIGCAHTQIDRSGNRDARSHLDRTPEEESGYI